MIDREDRGPSYRPDRTREELIGFSHEQLVSLVMELQTQRSSFWTYVRTTSEQIESLANLLERAIHFSGFTIAGIQRWCLERVQLHNELALEAKRLDLQIEPNKQ